MGNVLDLEKISSRSTHSKLNITEPSHARKYLIKVFNEIGLEFISARKDYASYIIAVIKFKDVRVKNAANSIFVKEIVAQIERKPCSRNLFKLIVPIYYEVENDAGPKYVLWYTDEKLSANDLDTSLIIAIDAIIYGA